MAAGDIVDEKEPCDCSLEFKLLSFSVLLYELALTQPYRRLQSAYNEVSRAIKDEVAAKERLVRARAGQDGADRSESPMCPITILENAVVVFGDHIKESTQNVVLLELAYLGQQRRASLVLWLDAICVLLLRWHAQPHFIFVPEAYIHVAINSFRVLGGPNNRCVLKHRPFSPSPQ